MSNVPARSPRPRGLREQAAVLEAGGPITYTVRDERLLMDDDGTSIDGDSAMPPRLRRLDPKRV